MGLGSQAAGVEHVGGLILCKTEGRTGGRTGWKKEYTAEAG